MKMNGRSFSHKILTPPLLTLLFVSVTTQQYYGFLNEHVVGPFVIHGKKILSAGPRKSGSIKSEPGDTGDESKCATDDSPGVAQVVKAGLCVKRKLCCGSSASKNVDAGRSEEEERLTKTISEGISDYIIPKIDEHFLIYKKKPAQNLLALLTCILVSVGLYIMYGYVQESSCEHRTYFNDWKLIFHKDTNLGKCILYMREPVWYTDVRTHNGTPQYLTRVEWKECTFDGESQLIKNIFEKENKTQDLAKYEKVIGCERYCNPKLCNPTKYGPPTNDPDIVDIAAYEPDPPCTTVPNGMVSVRYDWCNEPLTTLGITLGYASTILRVSALVILFLIAEWLPKLSSHVEAYCRNKCRRRRNKTLASTTSQRAAATVPKQISKIRRFENKAKTKIQKFFEHDETREEDVSELSKFLKQWTNLGKSIGDVLLRLRHDNTKPVSAEALAHKLDQIETGPIQDDGDEEVRMLHQRFDELVLSIRKVKAAMSALKNHKRAATGFVSGRVSESSSEDDDYFAVVKKRGATSSRGTREV